MSLQKLSDSISGNLRQNSEKDWKLRLEKASTLKQSAQTVRNCEEANIAWFLESVCSSRLDMISVWENINSGNFYDAWVTLEHIEICSRWLIKNPFLDLDFFGVIRLAKSAENWQSLYPYRVFISPEFIVKSEECSICGQSMGPWSDCSHKVGNVYCGEFCSRIVKDVDIGHVSLVSDPVQKYSAIIPKTEDGSDPMDYRLVEWVAMRCDGPFSDWMPKRGKRIHPHSAFDQGPSDLCPCRSEKRYDVCCLDKVGVEAPHIDIVFGHDIDPGLVGVQFIKSR